jgi:VanZ family protein
VPVRLIVRPPRWLRVLAGTLFVLAAALLLYQGAQPYAVGLFPVPWDKLVHAIVFAGFGALAWVSMGGTPPLADRIAPMAAFAVGIADEWAQAYVPGRVMDPGDLAADLLGAWLAVRILVGLRRRLAIASDPY